MGHTDTHGDPQYRSVYFNFVIRGDRLEERMKAAGYNRTSLAAEVGVKQPTITRLIGGSQATSSKLHRIARVIGTTPAYLTGETEDPYADAPDAPELTHQHRQLLNSFDRLGSDDRAAIIQIVVSLADREGGATVHSPRQPYRPEGEAR